MVFRNRKNKTKSVTLYSVSTLVGIAVAVVEVITLNNPIDLPSATSNEVVTQASIGSVMAASSPFYESFDNVDPSSPEPFINNSKSENWDIQYHNRDGGVKFLPVDAHHGSNCEAPGVDGSVTHEVTDAEDMLYNCKNHVMTAINDEGYGLVYLTPNQMVDFSEGDAVISFDISTLSVSDRDWWDVWVTPYEDNLALPYYSDDVDLQGTPRNALNFNLIPELAVCPAVYKNFDEVEDRASTGCAWWDSYADYIDPSAMARSTVEITISRTHLKVGMPDLDLWWVDSDIEDLGWDTGIVQFGHHSYNPFKDGGGGPNTWHWDNFSINPASEPFTIIKADNRVVQTSNGSVEFDQPSPENSHLRFSALGKVAVSLNDGPFNDVSPQPGSQQGDHIEHLSSYFVPIPSGVTKAAFRFSRDDWLEGGFLAKDIAVWSTSDIVDPLPDTTPPTLSELFPVGELPYETVATTLSLSTSEAATCAYAATDEDFENMSPFTLTS